MTLLRQFVRLLPLLAAFLVLPAQPFGARVAVHGAAVVVSLAHGAPHLDDFVTRRNRHAASREEYLAIDDDSDEYEGPSPAASWTASDAPIGVVRDAHAAYDDPRPILRGRAHPPTGPPQA